VFIIWVLPYGLISAYDTAIGQEFLLSSYPKLGSLIPYWLPPIWFILGIIAIIFVTFEGAYRIVKREIGEKPKYKKPHIIGNIAMVSNERIHNCSNCGFGVVVQKWDMAVVCPECGNADDIMPDLSDFIK